MSTSVPTSLTSTDKHFWPPGCTTNDAILDGVTAGNLNSAKYFAAGMAGLIGIFIIQHVIRHTSVHMVADTTPGRIMFTPFRILRNFALKSLPGFTSRGHAMVVTIYVAVNLILCFTMLDWPLPLLSDWARRLGWVAVANIAFLFFLALKNTPLAYLTEYSYERLNELHQIAGYSTILLSVLHTIVFIAARAQQHELCNIVDNPQHPGMVATGAMIVIGITSLVLKSRKYEAFYIIHVIMSLAIVATVSLHRPDFSTYSVRVMIFTAAIFIADRIIRAGRLFFNRWHQTATLIPLSGGGTSITLSRNVARAVPGKHALLMIRKAGFLQTHPFTIVSINPIKFIVDEHSGLTKRLHAMAIKERGVQLKATLDGPYGTLPSFEKYNKVILVAGGTGASFTFAVAINLLSKLDPLKNTTIEFIWAMRNDDKLSWYEEELHAIKASPLVEVSIYTTGHSLTNPDVSSGNSPEGEKVSDDSTASSSGLQTGEKPTRIAERMGLTLLTGRPPVTSLLGGSIRRASQHDRVVVGACGPAGLMNDTRNAVAKQIGLSGQRIDLHIESFGW